MCARPPTELVKQEKTHPVLLCVSQHSFALSFSLSISPTQSHNRIRTAKNTHAHASLHLPLSHAHNKHLSLVGITRLFSPERGICFCSSCHSPIWLDGWWVVTQNTCHTRTHRYTQPQNVPQRMQSMRANMFERRAPQINTQTVSAHNIWGHKLMSACKYEHTNTEPPFPNASQTVNQLLANLQGRFYYLVLRGPN